MLSKDIVSALRSFGRFALFICAFFQFAGLKPGTAEHEEEEAAEPDAPHHYCCDNNEFHQPVL